MNSKGFDESRLTAFVLGELNESEMEEVRRMVEQSPELQAELEEIRSTVAYISSEFQAEEQVGLKSGQKIQVMRRAGLRQPRLAGQYRWWAAAAAACVLLAVGIRLARVEPVSETPFSQIEQALGNGRPGGETLPDGPLSPGEEDPGASVTGSQVAAGNGGESGPGTLAALESRLDAGKKPGTISGIVKDSTGTALPGVVVEIQGTGVDRRTVSNEAGEYHVEGLPPGRYELASELPGFVKDEKKVEIREPGRQVSQDFEMPVASVAEMVEVAPESHSAAAKTQDAGIVPGRGTGIGEKLATAVVGGVPGGVIGGVAAPAQPMSRMKGDFMAYPVPDEPVPPVVVPPDFDTEAYDRILDNPFVRVAQDPLSTFSIDVDTGSYSNVRRFLADRTLPPKDAVRIEELVNYFSYDYPAPSGKAPFSVSLEAAKAPWKAEHRLVRIGLKGREIALDQRKAANLVFLLDVSGSMEPENKLLLLKRSLRLLVDKLNEKDRVAIVVYAGASGLVLPSTECTRKEVILQALECLHAGGSTNGGQGLLLAYRTAEENFLKDGINRVILATDGDFNMGVTNQGDLTRLIEEKAKSKVFLTVLGFGMGNLKDSTLEKLADRGNGSYGYIDSLQEARRILVEQIGGTLVTIAKDVKVQVEFNPALVEAYRLVGYENRMLRHEDFNDDRKDAGEIGAGLTVTALYEVVPKGVPVDVPIVDPLKYQSPASKTGPSGSPELLTVKLRYKEPDADVSQLLEFPLVRGERDFDNASTDFRFAASVASFGMLLRESQYAGDASFEKVLAMASASLGKDSGGYRSEFLNLVKKARALRELEQLP